MVLFCINLIYVDKHMKEWLTSPGQVYYVRPPWKISFPWKRRARRGAAAGKVLSSFSRLEFWRAGIG